MLGYPLPTDVFPTSEGECPGSAPAIMDNLNGAIEDACKEVGATYLDERFIGGANTAGGSWSPGSLHADSVHLNKKGCKVCRAIHASRMPRMMRYNCLCAYASTYLYIGTHARTTHNSQTLHYTATDDTDTALHYTLYTTAIYSIIRTPRVHFVSPSRVTLASPSLHATSLRSYDPTLPDCAIVTSDSFRAQFGCTANKADCVTVKELTDAASPRATSHLAGAGLVVLTVAGLVLGGL